MVIEKQDPRIGAVASILAAEFYKLKTLRKNIESHHQNYTRFLVIERPKAFSEAHKASVSFTLSHKRGALSRVLTCAEENAFNLTKIQSAPIHGEPWRYRFFVDLLSDVGLSEEILFRVFSDCTESFEIIGIYEEGKHYEA
jgi:prephenate dehydratase